VLTLLSPPVALLSGALSRNDWSYSPFDKALRSANGLFSSSSSSSSVSASTSESGAFFGRWGSIDGFVAADGRGGGCGRDGEDGEPRFIPAWAWVGGLVGELGSFPLAFSVATAQTC